MALLSPHQTVPLSFLALQQGKEERGLPWTTNQLLGLDVLPSSAPRHSGCVSTVGAHPAAAWEKQAGDKISWSFYYWDFIFKSNGKYITGGKTPEVWASLWDSSMPLLCDGYPAHPRRNVVWELAVGTISMATKTMRGLILPSGIHQGGAVAYRAAGRAEPCQEASHGHRVPGKLWWEGPFLSKQYWYLQPEKIKLGVCKLRTVLERLERDEATSSSSG